MTVPYLCRLHRHAEKLHHQVYFFICTTQDSLSLSLAPTHTHTSHELLSACLCRLSLNIHACPWHKKCHCLFCPLQLWSTFVPHYSIWLMNTHLLPPIDAQLTTRSHDEDGHWNVIGIAVWKQMHPDLLGLVCSWCPRSLSIMSGCR